MGGQAVLEGVMMRGPENWAVSVRLPDGSISTNVEPVANWSERYRPFPLVRGVAALGESLALGYRALQWSANQQLSVELEREAAELDAIDRSTLSASRLRKLDKQLAKSARQVASMSEGAVGATMAVALVFFSGIFLVLPALVGKGLHGLADRIPEQVGESLFRLGFFVGYLALISLMKDIRRVFEYHGAEHKAIAAYESGVALTPKSADQFTTAHVRCGTNFLLTVMVIAIGVYSFVPTSNIFLLIGSRIILIPLIAGIAYEVIRQAAKRMHLRSVRGVMQPGLLLQRLTTRPPDLNQLEVAIASLKACMTPDQLAEVEGRDRANKAVAS